MTKTLTEQWREGTLPAGCYYVLSTEDDTTVACDIDVVCDFMIRDVVEPVPSYDWYKRLVSNSDESSRKALQLEIATKALSDIEDGYSKATGAGQIVRQALKEMKGVK